jgi:hypothetical protein
MESWHGRAFEISFEKPTNNLREASKIRRFCDRIEVKPRQDIVKK